MWLLSGSYLHFTNDMHRPRSLQRWESGTKTLPCGACIVVYWIASRHDITVVRAAATTLQLLLLIIRALDFFIYNSAVRHARPETHELAMCQNNAVPMLFPRAKDSHVNENKNNAKILRRISSNFITALSAQNIRTRMGNWDPNSSVGLFVTARTDP
jgi:hypothetical protein